MYTSLFRSPLLMFAISTSFFGLLLVVTLAFNPPTTEGDLPWRKPIIGAIFGSICVLGAVAVFIPKRCSAMFHSPKGEKNSNSNVHLLASHGNSPTLRGHHPDCGNFSAHMVRIGDKTTCAACTGLLLGALIVLAGATLYFFGDWHVAQNAFLAVLVGLLGVGSGLFQFKFRSFIRLLLNAYFVLGALFVLVGIDEIAQSLFVDLFLVALTIFWLFTRILLSQWDHWRICYTCRTPCKIREKRGEVSIYGSVH